MEICALVVTRILQSGIVGSVARFSVSNVPSGRKAGSTCVAVAEPMQWRRGRREPSVRSVASLLVQLCAGFSYALTVVPIM